MRKTKPCEFAIETRFHLDRYDQWVERECVPNARAAKAALKRLSKKYSVRVRRLKTMRLVKV